MQILAADRSQGKVDAAPLTQVDPARRSRGQMAHLSGLVAEDQVAADYLRRGYQLLQARWRGRSGEIDLIFADTAADARGFIFVEVKRSRSFARALDMLRPAQQRRIMAAAEEYLAFCGLDLMQDMRFDLALLDGAGRIEILENVLF